MLLTNKLLGNVPMVYREGGGKSGGGQTATPPPMITTTSIGSALDAAQPTFEEDKDKTSMIDKKKLGTRGLQIPLANPTTTNTAAGPAYGVSI